MTAAAVVCGSWGGVCLIVGHGRGVGDRRHGAHIVTVGAAVVVVGEVDAEGPAQGVEHLLGRLGLAERGAGQVCQGPAEGVGLGVGHPAFPSLIPAGHRRMLVGVHHVDDEHGGVAHGDVNTLLTTG